MSPIQETSTPKDVQDFPNAERFAKELVRIKNIEFFKPRGEPDPVLLQELVNQHLERLGLQEALINIIRDDDFREDAELHAMCNVKFNVKCDVMQLVVGRETTETEYAPRHAPRALACNPAILNAVWDIVWNKIKGVETETDVTGDMVGNAAWIIAEDKMIEGGYAKGNPFSPLITIYELGCLPIGLVENAEGKTEFVIFIPPIQKMA
jgi:hypothetical protein